ncbi:TPA: DUF1107 domain-containing protein [Photobacterium damselae]
MLRIFKQYRPIQVARHVKKYFRGRVFIWGVGAFEFDKGRLLPAEHHNIQALNTLSEVNRHIDALAVDLTLV